MFRKFFIYNVICVCLLSLGCHVYGDSSLKDPNKKLIVACENTLQKEEEENHQFDILFQVLLEESAKMYEQLEAACKEDEIEDIIQAIEILKASSSGKRLMEVVRDIQACSDCSACDTMSEECLSSAGILQQLAEITETLQNYSVSTSSDYLDRNLDIREKELEFKRELLAWEKEKAKQDLAWKRESYVRDALLLKK
ncbi:hypothetical protein [Candidatus Chlamydia sanziniae]|uniref:Lipoprotein n=1 Tax=Candidatus Chlamydia sanziniae TaxID=1806891 RepID=A0A1A9HV24_9CHLA|nr:hypothetical protein [Candidatus Chlamydia sanziniae]ANH78850.1 hypothetical protein Cs308_0680 [Candidatus Chlamydia sanziniae]